MGRAAAREFLGEAPIVLRQRAQLVGNYRVETRFRKGRASQGVRKQLLFSHEVPLTDETQTQCVLRCLRASCWRVNAVLRQSANHSVKTKRAMQRAANANAWSVTPIGVSQSKMTARLSQIIHMQDHAWGPHACRCRIMHGRIKPTVRPLSCVAWQVRVTNLVRPLPRRSRIPDAPLPMRDRRGLLP